MTEQNKTKVPAELIPAGNYPVVSTDAVMDKQKGKTQEEVNTEAGEKIAALEESVGSGGSVDTRIENAFNTEKARAENVEAQLSNEIDVLQKQDVVPVDSLPSVDDADPKKIYRVVSTTSYTDYMVDTMADPTAWKILATYSFPGIDNEPTPGSENLVKSGGVKNELQEINDTVNGAIQENTQSITPTFTQGACFADTSHSNFGGVNTGISDCKVTGRISLADYLGKSNLKIRLTFPKTNNSNYLKYGAVFYAQNSNTFVIQAGATCIASSESNSIETIEIPVPPTANFFRTTFWASDTYGEFSMEFVWDVQQEGLVSRIETLEGSVENLSNEVETLEGSISAIEDEVEELKNVDNIYWAACGDSITNANHDGIDDIPNDDPYKPIDGYSEVSTYNRKNYAYYIAKEKNIKWANYGWGGTTLGMFNSKAYPNVHPFVGERIENMKEGIDWNYISILFGWNDLTFGVVYQKDKWLQETYGEDIGYPVQASQIGAAGFATQEQKDACDAATGSVGGIQYDNNEDYFVARMIGTISDTGKDTYMGAYNYTLDYLMKKYQKSKILICVPFVPNHGSMFYNAVVAIANKWGVPYFDFEDMKYWYRLRVTNTTTLMNPDREDGKWVNYKGYLCPANVAGYNRARFSADDTHPSNLGYQVMSSPFGDKLFNG